MIIRGVMGLAVSLWGAYALADDLASQGKIVFMEDAQPACSICHTLSDAGATGEIGPNLDELAPSQEQVRNAVKGGVGLMPAFGDTLTEEQINAVAHYVASITGGGS